MFINKLEFGDEKDELKRALMAASAVHISVLKKAAEEIGSKKLGEVFKLLARAGTGGG